MHHPLGFFPLDPEGDVDAAVELVHLPGDPGNLLRKVDLVAEKFAALFRSPEGVEGGADDGG